MPSILDRFLTFYTTKAPSLQPGDVHGGGWASYSAQAPVDYNTQQYLLTYEKVGWVYATVDRIATAVAEAQWHLYEKPKRGTGTTKQKRIELDDHPLIELLHSVNPFETFNEHMELSQDYMELAGEVFWVILRNGVGGASELWAINPTQIEVIPSREKFIAGYLYSMGAERIPLDPKDVIHIKRPNPRNRYRGLAPIAPIMTDIESQRYSSLWNRNFFRNSAEPGGVIEVEKTLGEDAFERLVQQWSEEHRGTANTARVAVLEGGAKWVPTRTTQRDMQFALLRKDNRDTILANYGMPLHVLGIAESVNRANAEAGEYVFSRWVIKPRLVRIREKLNEKLVPLYDPKGLLELDFDDPVPANREFNLARSERLYKSGIATKNEVRGMSDLDPDEENTDVYFVPSGGTETPVDQAQRQKQADDAAKRQQAIAAAKQPPPQLPAAQPAVGPMQNQPEAAQQQAEANAPSDETAAAALQRKAYEKLLEQRSNPNHDEEGRFSSSEG